ncbi:MAG: RelA/SpoT family protein [Patescibacteria group bacterium]
MTPSLEMLLKSLSRASAQDRDLVSRAWKFAEEAHHSQKRESGEPFFTHVAKTAETLAALGADAPTIAAGLLHDSIEDTGKDIEEIRDTFGLEVAFLVDGVTKLGKLKYRGLKRHVESLRKLFIATAEDPRVILIKLADRLHNMKTLSALPQEKRMRIALETLEIYAPIAHRLGIGKVKGELEDLAFQAAYQEAFTETRKARDEKAKRAESELKKMVLKIGTMLRGTGVKVHTLDTRIKHLYSLHKKLQEKGKNIENVYDIAALRIIVETVEECYLVLGLIHSAWKPLPGRIKDYIAVPKPNGYRSLHTSVFTGTGSVIEIQIRTQEMHDVAEHGIASHVAYKEDGSTDGSFALAQNLIKSPLQIAAQGISPRWIKDLAETHKDEQQAQSFIKNLKTDFLGDRIFVFTPKGEVVDLPSDATPIDFAYSIHTDLGHHAAGARVNGKYVALGTKLKHGDIVEIETKEASHPSAKWLTWVKTSFAKKKIRTALEHKK